MLTSIFTPFKCRTRSYGVKCIAFRFCLASLYATFTFFGSNIILRVLRTFIVANLYFYLFLFGNPNVLNITHNKLRNNDRVTSVIRSFPPMENDFIELWPNINLIFMDSLARISKILFKYTKSIFSPINVNWNFI